MCMLPLDNHPPLCREGGIPGSGTPVHRCCPEQYGVKVLRPLQVSDELQDERVVWEGVKADVERTIGCRPPLPHDAGAPVR